MHVRSPFAYDRRYCMRDLLQNGSDQSYFNPFRHPRRSDVISRMWRPYLFNTTAFSDRVIQFCNLRSITFGSKCCCTSCFFSNRVRSMKCVYLAHALAYRSVCAMNTPYDPSLGMLPDKSGKLTILKGKSSRLSYKDVTISWFTTSSCRSR